MLAQFSYDLTIKYTDYFPASDGPDVRPALGGGGGTYDMTDPSVWTNAVPNGDGAAAGLTDPGGVTTLTIPTTGVMLGNLGINSSNAYTIIVPP